MRYVAQISRAIWRARSFQAFLAIALQQGQVLVAGLICFTVLGAAEYGRVAISLSALNTLISIGSLSSPVVAYRSSLDPQMDDQRLGAVLRRLRGLLALSAGLLAAGVVGLWFTGVGEEAFKAASGFELLAVTGFLAVSVLASYQQGVLLGRCDLGLYLSVNAVIFVVAPFMVFRLSTDYGFAGYFLSLAVAMMIRAAFLERRVLSAFSAGSRDDPSFRQTLVSFMVPATIAGLTTLPAYWWSSELVYRQPNGAYFLGLIALITTVKQVPLLVCSSVVSSQGRLVFSNHSIDPTVAVQRYRFLASRLFVLGTGLAVIAVGGFEVALAVLRDALPIDTQSVRPIVWALSLALVLEAMNLVTYLPITIVGSMWESFWSIALPRDTAFVLMSVLFTNLFGWAGFLVALIVSQIFGIVLTIRIGRRDRRTRAYFTHSVAR